jgi:hypothetical protein
MVAIGPAEDFDEVFLTLEIAHQLMNQPNVFHEIPNGNLIQ